MKWLVQFPVTTLGNSAEDAAASARAYFIDAGTTEVRAVVQQLDEAGNPVGESKTLYVQDPDLSDEG